MLHWIKASVLALCKWWHGATAHSRLVQCGQWARDFKEHGQIMHYSSGSRPSEFISTTCPVCVP